MQSKNFIITSPTDNVAIAVRIEGIAAGTILNDQVTTLELIPMGHKVALQDITAGSPVIRYGYTIGLANTLIPKGTWIKEQMLEIPDAPSLDTITYQPIPIIQQSNLEGYTFEGYRNADGTVFFSEVTEVRDAVVQLVNRSATEEVAQKLIAEMKWYDEYLQKGDADRTANTTPGNKKGGLSNIVEKALGSVVKSGTMPIMDVLSPGERIKKKGLQFVATPASDFVCGTLQLAAGMNLHVFITGRGTPYGLTMVPVIKISSNSKLANRWHDLIDFDAGPVATGEKTIEELGWALFHDMLDVASGRKKVATDKLGLYNDLVLFNPGPLT
jgi:altronate dehydratase